MQSELAAQEHRIQAQYIGTIESLTNQLESNKRDWERKEKVGGRA